MASVTVFGNTDVADTGMMPPAYIVQEMKEELLHVDEELCSHALSSARRTLWKELQTLMRKDLQTLMRK